MSDQPTPNATTPATTPATGIAGLRRMSTTAGVGAVGGREYRSVNPLAVASVVLAVLGVAASIHPLALLLPALGLVAAAIGIVQVRRSNGTQTGTVLAMIGLVLALGMLGFFGVRYALGVAEEASYREEIAADLQAFGDALAAEDYATARNYLSATMQQQVTPDEFIDVVARYPRTVDPDGNLVFGNFASAEPGPRVVVRRDPQTGRPSADAELILKFATGREDRQSVQLIRLPGGWRITDLGNWGNAPTWMN